MDWNPQVTSARMVPWDKKSWGVEVEFADGFSVTYPTTSQADAVDDLSKLQIDPIFALKVRWGKQWI